MKNDKLNRSFYIILVPIILVVILINSGFLQARVPAININGEGFNVSQFNFYYFTAYNDFVAENFDEFGNGPFDESTALRDQDKEEGVTWKDYFASLAQERMIEVVYYSTLAEEAGYVFSEQELQPVQDQLNAINADCAANNITLKNYLVAYWGVGMTQEIYTAELTRAAKADAYKACLTVSAPVSDSEVAAWIAENDPDSYPSANLRLIVLDAAPDRFTARVGEQQLSDLEAKLERLQARYEADPDAFGDLAAAFSDDETLAGTRGELLNGTWDNLPAAVAQWVFSGGAQPGESAALLDEQAGQAYLAILDSWGDNAAGLTAAAAVQAQQIGAELAQVQDSASVSHNPLGWRLVGR